MYCSKCGTYMNDDDKFCPNCGTGADGQAPAAVVSGPKPVRAPRKKLSNKALIGILAGAAVAILAVVLIIVLVGGGSNSPEGVINKFVKAYFNEDLEGMLEASVPDEVLDYVLREEGMSRSEFQRQLKNAQAEIDSYRKEYGQSQRVSGVTIVGSRALDRDDLEDLNSYYNRKYRTGKYYISEAQEVTVRLNSYYGDSGTEEIVVFKVNGKWYVSLDDVPNVLNDII